MYKNCDKCAQINNINNLFCIKCGNIFASEDYLLDFYKIRIPETEKVTERYFILRTIKSGGMGNIFMALDMHLDKVCAIKELRISSTDDDIDMEMFETEARLLSSLQHCSLPRVNDYFSVNRKYYLVMDYIYGDDLLTIMNENSYTRGFPEEQVLDWAIRICDVLSYLHNREPQIIYRDLKPSNIMIRRADNSLILIDFGIARLSLKNSSSSSHEFLTPGYASPEQYGMKHCDVRSDIYSLGSTLYHLITGIRPQGFYADISPKKIKREISLYMDYVITKSKEMKAKDRYQSVDELKSALSLWKDPFYITQSDNGLSNRDLLILQLKSNEINKKIYAIKALSGIIYEKSTIALIKILNDDNMTVQKHAAIALGDIGDNIAIDGLLNLLGSDNQSVRTCALESLKKIVFPDDEILIANWIKDLFSHKDASVRFFAFTFLNKIKHEAFYNNLLHGLTDKDHNVKRLCAIILMEWGREEGLEPLKKALDRESMFSITTKRILQNALSKLTESVSNQQKVENNYEKSSIKGCSKFKTSLMALPEQFKDTHELPSIKEYNTDIPSSHNNSIEKNMEPSKTLSPKGLLEKYREKVKEGKIKVSRPLFSDISDINEI